MELLELYTQAIYNIKSQNKLKILDKQLLILFERYPNQFVCKKSFHLSEFPRFINRVIGLNMYFDDIINKIHYTFSFKLKMTEVEPKFKNKIKIPTCSDEELKEYKQLLKSPIYTLILIKQNYNTRIDRKQIRYFNKGDEVVMRDISMDTFFKEIQFDINNNADLLERFIFQLT